MSKKTDSTAVMERPGTNEVPAYLRGEAEGLEQAAQFKSIAFLKVVQKAGAEDLTSEFGLGSTILQPARELVCEYGEPFTARPIFFFPSWQKRKDANDPGRNPVVAQTQDENHEIAIKAKDMELWEEAYPDNPKLFYKYAEALNFIVYLEELDTCAAVTYLIGSHREGKRLCDYLVRRGVSIYANRLSFAAEKKSNPNSQEYYVLTFRAASPAFIGEQDIEPMKALHQEVKAAFEKRAVGIAADSE